MGIIDSPTIGCSRTLVAVLALLLGTSARALACVNDADCIDPTNFNKCIVFACQGGNCVRVPPNCDDDNACTIDNCDLQLGICVHDPLCPPNGSACNPAPHCARSRFPPFEVLCVGTLPPNCDDSNACTIDMCAEPDGCEHVPVDCNDGNPCTTDGCDPASGCTHTRIPNCCATAADCLVDKCHARVCQAQVCTGDPLPISCDDADPSTIDACDPAVGCTHTPPVSTTTSTTLVGGGTCRVDGDCAAPDDACAVAACDGGQCGSRAVTGLDALGCVCRRAEPGACAGVAIPHRVTTRRHRACAFIAKVSKGGKKAPKLAKHAATLLAKAGKGLSAAKHVAPACLQALGAQLADDAARAVQVGRQHSP